MFQLERPAPHVAARKLGLENHQGANHCFLNVVIQALWNLQTFRTRLLAAPAFGRTQHESQVIRCYCELKSLFQEYSVSDEKTVALPPDGLRRALSSVYNADGRFKLGEMEDASETLDAILGILHASHLELSCLVPAAPADLEKASAFGCHPLCFAHDIFGIEYVDVPHCSSCGATGEPSMNSSYLYTTYATELLEATRGSGEEEISTDPIGVLQDMLARTAARFTGPPASLQELLSSLGGQSQQPCIDCKSSKIREERWLTRKPQIFTISLVWPNSTPNTQDILFILCMLKPQLKLEEIFQVPPPSDDASYCFHGLICYKHSQHYVAFFWCAARKRWTFFDDRLVQEKDDWVSVANMVMADGYVPTLIFYERRREADDELDRQVQALQESSCVAM